MIQLSEGDQSEQSGLIRKGGGYINTGLFVYASIYQVSHWVAMFQAELSQSADSISCVNGSHPSSISLG